MKAKKLMILVAATMLLPQVSFAQGGADSFSLLQQIQEMQATIRKQNGQIELLQHQIDQNKKHRQQMYQDLDERLSRLEPDIDEGRPVGVSTDKQLDAKADYEKAYEQLKGKHYDKAISQFQAFVKQYPDDAYTPNAWYWLGQVLYVKGQLDKALKALEHVVNDYPDSNKMASTLYRIGIIYSDQDDQDKAQALFKKIVEDYPDSRSAKMAQKRLD